MILEIALFATLNCTPGGVIDLARADRENLPANYRFNACQTYVRENSCTVGGHTDFARAKKENLPAFYRFDSCKKVAKRSGAYNTNYRSNF